MSSHSALFYLIAFWSVVAFIWPSPPKHGIYLEQAFQNSANIGGGIGAGIGAGVGATIGCLIAGEPGTSLGAGFGGALGGTMGKYFTNHLY